MTLQTLQTDLLDIVNHIIRASKGSRDKVLDWFALIVNSNHKRRALQVDNRTVSSDGFMVNVTFILDQLCEPFMDASFSKVLVPPILGYLADLGRLTGLMSTTYEGSQESTFARRPS